MRIHTLLENTTRDSSLTIEHGLSFYIETSTHKILFDSGYSGAFAENADRMGIDLSQVDFAVLSHAHRDHSGGLQRFLEKNPTAPVYLSRHAFGNIIGSQGNYFGLEQSLKENPRLIPVDDELSVTDDLILYSCNRCSQLYPNAAAGFTVFENGVSGPDLFHHEQYLLIREGDKRILFSGCSHKGNIVNWFEPDVLIGGFHFMHRDPEGKDADFLRFAAQTLLAHHTIYYTCHCTGEAPYRFLREIMGDRLQYLSTGVSIDL